MAPARPQPQEEVTPPAPRIGRDEMNLAEFPIALLADRVPKGQKTLYFEDQHGRLTITGSDAYGLPTATDTDVIVALIYLTKLRNGFSDVKVNFSRYELINLLNWRDEGDSYKRLNLSFNRWGGVWLVYDKCWWNNRLKCYTSAKMHIIENVEIIDNDARRKAHHAGQNGLPLSYFTWDRKFVESCQADNLRQLNLDTYFSLKSAVSKRLYRFLGKRFYLQGDWTFDLNEIAFERVGLSRSYEHDAGKIKEKLQPAIDELEAIGFLRPLSRDDRYNRIDRGQWTIRFARQSPALVAPQQPALPAAQPAEPEPPPLVAALVQHGVTRKTAAELVRDYPAKKIQLQIEILDYRLAGKKADKIDDPAAYLISAIKSESGYTAPKGFTSRAERQQREEARQAKEREAAEVRRQKQQAEADEKAELRKAEAYWQSLTPAEQQQLEAAALAAGGEEARQTYETMKNMRAGAGYLKMLRNDYIRGILQQQTEPA